MDILVDKLFSLQDSLQDGILVLPHLLSGFFFFIGILTSNIGMLCLALGHFIIVPSISVFANREWPFTGVDFVQTLPSALILAFLLFFMNGLSFASLSVFLIPLVYALKTVYSFLGEGIPTLFDTLNPYVWFNGIPKPPAAAVDLCFLSPEEQFSQGQRRSPSGWTIHLLFFLGFLIGNASTIYSMPIPTIKKTDNAKQNASAQEALEIRVNNRKLITGTIIGLSIIVGALLLYVRYSMSPCEGSIYENIFPMLYCFLFGLAFFSLITVSCGIPASDILGLVQGFISPGAIDNPIVCIGSAPST
jgi:hypothetical protein